LRKWSLLKELQCGNHRGDMLYFKYFTLNYAPLKMKISFRNKGKITQ